MGDRERERDKTEEGAGRGGGKKENPILKTFTNKNISKFIALKTIYYQRKVRNLKFVI
jgi:hypothetical protein